MTSSLGTAFLAGAKGRNLTETVFKDGCAYHLNGGLDCDIYSESNIKGFFPVGEAAAVFGKSLINGASLAATQITAFRAAEKIAEDYNSSAAELIEMQDFGSASADEVSKYTAVAGHLLKNAKRNIVSENISQMRQKYQKRFSDCCMEKRSLEDITLAIAECRYDIANFINDNKIDDVSYLSDVFENHDILITQYMFLNAARNYLLSADEFNRSNLVSFISIKNTNTFEINFSKRTAKEIPGE
jgi:succinate dehydrogenase/fumarate reductase flavoprotein subunit